MSYITANDSVPCLGFSAQFFEISNIYLLYFDITELAILIKASRNKQENGSVQNQMLRAI